MADAPEGDEFDNVPDLFDWAAIPDSLCLAADHADDSVPTSSSVAAEDEDLFEHFVDSLADVDWNTIPELAAIEASAVPSSPTRQTLAETARRPPSSPQPRHPVLPALNLSSSGVVGSLLLGEAVASVSASNAGSSHSYLHLVNPPANTAMDSQVAGAHEANALSHERATPAAPHIPASRSNGSTQTSQLAFEPTASAISPDQSSTPISQHVSSPSKRGVEDAAPSSATSCKRPRSASSDDCQPTKSKRRRRNKRRRASMADPDPHVGIRQVLAEYEEDLSCPICCDIVAAAYMSNPCGHTFCGNCAWVWVSKNRRTPTCAVCRANLVPSSPLIPNIAIDHTVEKHISALVQSGSEDWLPEGAAFTEWMRRKESGKSVVSNHLANCR